MKKFFLLLIPVLLSIGFMRLAINSDNGFLPEPSELINIFDSFPDIVDTLKNNLLDIKYFALNLGRDFNFPAWSYTPFDSSGFVEFFESIGRFFTETFSNIGAMFTGLFQGLGTFFKSIWQIITLIFDILMIPIDVVLWFMRYILGLPI